jgi:preprotein translocase subunit SecF
MEQETNTSTSKRQSLSKEVKRKLADITAEIENQGSSNAMFIKFKDGEHKLLSFIPEKTYSDMVSYPNSPDKPVKRYKFYAYDLTFNRNSQEEKEWTVGPTVTKELLRWISKGYFVFSITRHGVDLKTTYDIEPEID